MVSDYFYLRLYFLSEGDPIVGGPLKHVFAKGRSFAHTYKNEINPPFSSCFPAAFLFKATEMDSGCPPELYSFLAGSKLNFEKVLALSSEITIPSAAAIEEDFQARLAALRLLSLYFLLSKEAAVLGYLHPPTEELTTINSMKNLLFTTVITLSGKRSSDSS